MGKKITVDGHGRATVDCQATSFGDFPKRGFIFANGKTLETVLRGVRIVRCQSKSVHDNSLFYDFSDFVGGGIVVIQSAVLLENLEILSCIAYSQGGGVLWMGKLFYKMYPLPTAQEDTGHCCEKRQSLALVWWFLAILKRDGNLGLL